MLDIQNARVDARAEHQIAVRNCGSDAGCKRRAQDEHAKRQRNIDSRLNAENARHRKQMNAIAELERMLRARRKAEQR